MQEETTTDTTTEQATSPNEFSPELLAAAVAQLKEQQSGEPDNAKVKENINNAYAQRDEMAKELEQLRADKREAELKRLEEAGKKDEADAMRLKEMGDQLKSAQDRVTSLTRDTALQQALAALDFTSEKAATIAHRDIVGTLIQNAVGDWVSPNGQSISDYAKFYAADESNSFLFKVKQSSGSSSMTGNTTTTQVQSNKSILEMSDSEMLTAFENGSMSDNGKWQNF